MVRASEPTSHIGCGRSRCSPPARPAPPERFPGPPSSWPSAPYTCSAASCAPPAGTARAWAVRQTWPCSTESACSVQPPAGRNQLPGCRGCIHGYVCLRQVKRGSKEHLQPQEIGAVGDWRRWRPLLHRELGAAPLCGLVRRLQFGIVRLRQDRVRLVTALCNTKLSGWQPAFCCTASYKGRPMWAPSTRLGTERLWTCKMK